MKELLLTLGHNSSAILVEDGRIVCGYENERVTGVKSDSRFPEHAIDYMCKQTGLKLSEIGRVYATHWAPSGRLSDMGAKYWHPGVFDGVSIRSLGPDQTHHDCHMAAAMCYAGSLFPYGDQAYGFVIDGFGIMGEHFSIYELPTSDPASMRLVKRFRGYDTSLGLWYQYATAFMGMKMHEDEYKLLGYEAHVTEEDAELILPQIQNKVKLWIDALHRLKYVDRHDPVYDVAALDNVRKTFFSHLADVCQRIGVVDPSSFDGRVKLSFYVQGVLEGVVEHFINQYKPQNVVLGGGVFQNVKLNLQVVRAVPGQTCAMPLCGDQGNALGLYYMDYPDFSLGNDKLLWGERDLKDVGVVENMHFCYAEEMVAAMADDLLRTQGYVNVVRGAMEFGPRALCNTSTLALPTRDTVSTINYMNDRNTVMPMAPVMRRDVYDSTFELGNRLWRSEEHMITALPYVPGTEHVAPGAAHGYTWPAKHFTGRPQVIRDNDLVMDMLLDRHGILINTSFNYHGKPIALDMESVVLNHMLQRQRDSSIHTIVLCNK